MVMLSIWLLLLIIPLSVCDAPNIPSNDPAIPEDEYDAIKLLWEEKHREIVYHEETKRSRLKPSYNEDTSPHQLDVIDVMKLTSSHHQTSHDQEDSEKSRHQTDSTDNDDTSSERSRRQTDNATLSDHDGSGSGDMRCDDPPSPCNGDIIITTTTVVYICEEGFVLRGNKYRSCNGTTWNGTDPTCEADCGYMPNVNCSDTNTTMKYYYNSTTQMCQQIMVCDNLTCLFNSSEECNQECPGPCVQDVPNSELCDSRELTYYYDKFNDRCQRFSEGCPAVRGNDNSFVNLQECLGTCRRSCDGPDTGGVTRLHREPWVTSNCSTCQCVNGLVTCQPMNLTTDCPILDCGEDKPIRLEEECCPVCPAACKEDNMTYSDGEFFMEGLCTTCQCISGQVNCTNETCPECPIGESPFNIAGQCCPECRSALGACELDPQEQKILPLFGGQCISLAPVALNECPEQCIKDDVINCCIPLTDTRQTDFECQFQPGVPIVLKYLDTTDCNCSPCG